MIEEGGTNYLVLYLNKEEYLKFKNEEPLDSIKATAFGIFDHHGEISSIDIELRDGVPALVQIFE